MTMLSIIQGAAREIGLGTISTAYGSTDDNVVQLIRLAEKDGAELVKRYDWQRLTKEQTFSALAAETQTSMVPTDFDHFIPDTFFNRSQKRMLVGPLTAAEWQREKGFSVSAMIDKFRQRGNDIIMSPTPTAGDTFAFEYVSKNWIDTDADGAGDATTFTADTNTILLSEELITLGVIWRYKSARGFDYAEDFRTYEAFFARVTGKDGGRRILDLSYPSVIRRGVIPLVPEGNWDVS